MRCVEILPVWIMNEDWSTSRDFCVQLNWFFTNQSQTECGGWIPRIEKHIIHIHGCPAFLWQGLEKDFPAEDVKGGIGRILVKWIQAFLTREPQFQIMLVKIYATILEGIFQSSCSSCTLFLIFISDSTKYLSVSKLQVQINFFFPPESLINFSIMTEGKLNRTLWTIYVCCEHLPMQLQRSTGKCKHVAKRGSTNK